MFTSLMCIAVAIYFEARGEPSAGQIAVAHVIQNRITDHRYPDNACDVVKQGYYWNGHPIKNKCQFSFYCDGKSDSPYNKQGWYNSLYIATLSSLIPDQTKGATHYHSIGVYPYWAIEGRVTAHIDGHIFYKGVQ
jgi:N-acetylmuramoyl-L-alanine amidase